MQNYEKIKKLVKKNRLNIFMFKIFWLYQSKVLKVKVLANFDRRFWPIFNVH